MEVAGIVLVSDGIFETFRSRLKHVDVYLACGLCMRLEVLLSSKIGREIVREFLGDDREGFAKNVELLNFPLHQGDFHLRYNREVGIQVECPLGYLSLPMAYVDVWTTSAGVALWEQSLASAVDSSDDASAKKGWIHCLKMTSSSMHCIDTIKGLTEHARQRGTTSASRCRSEE